MAPAVLVIPAALVAAGGVATLAASEFLQRKASLTVKTTALAGFLSLGWDPIQSEEETPSYPATIWTIVDGKWGGKRTGTIAFRNRQVKSFETGNLLATRSTNYIYDVLVDGQPVPDEMGPLTYFLFETTIPVSPALIL